MLHFIFEAADHFDWYSANNNGMCADVRSVILESYGKASAPSSSTDGTIIGSTTWSDPGTGRYLETVTSGSQQHVSSFSLDTSPVLASAIVAVKCILKDTRLFLNCKFPTNKFRMRQIVGSNLK